MIANSSPPRATPLTPFNSSPFSRGSRAVHQGLKKAKAVTNSAKDETDIDMGLFSSKDGTNGGNQCNPDSQTKLQESPTSSSCDANLLTPSSRGILKRRREAETDSEEAVTCSKKKVIFASPISVSKIIDNVLVAKGNKTIRRRKLKYDELTDETSNVKEAPTETIIESVIEEIPEKEIPVLNGAINENSENSEPVNNTKQMQTTTRKLRSSARATKAPSNPPTDSLVVKLETESKEAKAVDNIPESSDIIVNVKTDHEVISRDADDTDETDDIVFKNIESLLMKIDSSSSSSNDTPSSVGYFKEKFVSLNPVPVDKPADNDSPQKGNKLSCLLTSSKFEFDINCIPRLDPSQIIPKASIVIKRLTEELIYRLLGKERNQALGRVVIW